MVELTPHVAFCIWDFSFLCASGNRFSFRACEDVLAFSSNTVRDMLLTCLLGVQIWGGLYLLLSREGREAVITFPAKALMGFCVC